MSGHRMTRSTPLRHTARPLANAALLLAALAALLLLLNPAPSAARPAGSACSQVGVGATHHVRACAGRNRAGHMHSAKGHRSRRHHSVDGRKKTTHRAVHPPASPPSVGGESDDAGCEGGSEPADGADACEDGSRPSCPDASQPESAGEGSGLVCAAQGAPAPASPAEEADAEEDEEEDVASARVASAS